MSVVTVTVSSDGRTLDPACEMLSLDVRRELNRMPVAELVFLDGDIATREFPISDSGIFAPGKAITIKARYEGETTGDQTLFEGLVVRLGMESSDRGSLLRVELRDKAVKLTRPRRSQVFEKLTDSDLIKKLVSGAGLSTGTIEATTGQHESLVQYDCSDWDLLLSRAEANALVVLVQDGKLSAVTPAASGAPVLSIDYGISEVYDIEFETDALGQDASFKARTWDVKAQKVVVTAGKPAPDGALGNLNASRAAKALGFGDAVLVSATGIGAEEAKAWATAEAQRGALSMVRGRASIVGTAAAGLLDLVQVKGLPKAFAGKAAVTGLCHRIDADGWVTDLQFGLSPQPHRLRADISPPPASGLLPAVGGLQIGIVQKVDQDPAEQHRVKVKLPALGDEASCWARVAMPDAGKERGWYFWPEPGDEVVLGFFNQDPRQPVILGSMFGSTNKPPAAIMDASDKNLLRGLVTRKGMTLAFSDDDKPKLFLQTPGGAKILLDDDLEAIEISDKHKNKITLDKNGITIASGKDFKLDAKGNVELKGTKVDLK